ncbi:hypothetical protein PV10_04469 [Exophiala mesophila]|uniref:DUF4604 domain-containing protein n=1 Tax=Exophiala mesophila TaxID=212818 RepID=A0A0D1WV79_EXOME|nr:uncharacterized protein PV10_04469 [Exophiala mesophila]KIV93240.1 hypothetical protein PV10_04469 [Exophiala mesophila]
MAFNAKNLHYDKQEPAFLRRLKGQFGGDDGRHNVQIARPKRDRLKTADDDDDPLIVDEQGETVAKEEYERRLKGEDVDPTAEADGEASKKAPDSQTEQDAGQAERQKVTGIGDSKAKKRKVGKVVGGDGQDEVSGPSSVKEQDAGAEKGVASSKEAEKVKGQDAPVTKKKKAKKIKLSFDEPDD